MNSSLVSGFYHPFEMIQQELNRAERNLSNRFCHLVVEAPSATVKFMKDNAVGLHRVAMACFIAIPVCLVGGLSLYGFSYLTPKEIFYHVAALTMGLALLWLSKQANKMANHPHLKWKDIIQKRNEIHKKQAAVGLESVKEARKELRVEIAELRHQIKHQPTITYKDIEINECALNMLKSLMSEKRTTISLKDYKILGEWGIKCVPLSGKIDERLLNDDKVVYVLTGEGRLDLMKPEVSCYYPYPGSFIRISRTEAFTSSAPRIINTCKDKDMYLLIQTSEPICESTTDAQVLTFGSLRDTPQFFTQKNLNKHKMMSKWRFTKTQLKKRIQSH